MFEAPESREEPPRGFELVRFSKLFHAIYDGMTRIATFKDFYDFTLQHRVLDGFEDIIDKPLGAGFFYNTPGVVRQFCFVLSIAPHPAIREAMDSPAIRPREVIAEFRKKGVLSHFKVLDLGCGRLPSFARAARALGADVYTADIEKLNSQNDEASRHTVINLNQEDAGEVLLVATGGNFDVVTAHIIGQAPSYLRKAEKVEEPAPDALRLVAGGLLKRGGYFFHADDTSDHCILRKV